MRQYSGPSAYSAGTVCARQQYRHYVAAAGTTPHTADGKRGSYPEGMMCVEALSHEENCRGGTEVCVKMTCDDENI